MLISDRFRRSDARRRRLRGFPEAEEHVLTTADGEKVIVWHVPAKPGRPVILFFHGNGDFLAGRVSRFRNLVSDGTGLVALSFRGYAGSTGSPSEEGLLKDAAAAYAFAAERYEAQPDRGVGFLARYRRCRAIASEHPVAKLILEAPYTSTVDVAASLFPIAPVSLLMRDQFHSDQRIGRVTRAASHHAWRRPIRPSHSSLANVCLLWPMSRNNSSVFPAAVTKIWMNFGAIETVRHFIRSFAWLTASSGCGPVSA